ncbi:beta strand repeat-containing protein [Deinococcus aquaticus]|uniref:beta strand repeat-containing protein n=1 Tax=Deinococcus aquaticus TaxID=328692 RepID=UPI003F47B23D
MTTTPSPTRPARRPIWRTLLTAAALTVTSLAGAYQIVGDLSATPTTWSGTRGTQQNVGTYAGGNGAATFRSGLTVNVTASRDTTNNQNSFYIGDASGATTTLKDPMSSRAGTGYTGSGFSPAFTTANVEGLYLLSTTLRQDGSFITQTVTSGSNSQTARIYEDPACYGSTGTAGSTGSCLRGILTINFSRPVTNPVFHLTGLGGFITRTNDVWGVATRYRLLTGGVTLAMVGTPQNLSVTTLSGQPSIGVTSFGTGTLVTSGTPANTYDVIQSSCTPAANTTSAGCGSVQTTGTFSQLQFEVSTETKKVAAGTSTTNAYPAGQYDSTKTNGSIINMNFAADATNFAVSVSEDFGDAPASYDPTAAASHVLGDLKLGSAVDAENPAVLNGGTAVTPSPSAVAAGADNNGANGDGADEDAITTFPALASTATGYSLTVPVSGASAAGQVCGWIDFDRGGTFVTGERACAAFASGATSVTLNWSGLSGLSAGTNYVRLRASYDTAGVQNPTGRLDSGEVEDYRLTITPGTDLSVTKTNSVSSVNTGSSTVYTVRVTNAGPSSVTGAVLTDAAITGLNVTGVACSGTPGQCTAGTTPTAAQLQAGYALPALSSGQFYELTVTGTVTATVGSLANTATVAAPSGVTDTNSSNNSVTDTDTVTAPDLTISKSHTGTWTQADLGRTYTLTVTNSGTGPTSGTVTVTDTLPAGLSAWTISGTGWTCTLGTLTCTRSDVLSAGGSYPAITVTVDVDIAAPASVTNTAAVSGGGQVNTANDSASDPTTITATSTGLQNCSVLNSASPTSLNFSGAGALVSGTANTVGAVYRFSNVTTGMDALVTVTQLSVTGSATLLGSGLSAALTSNSNASVEYRVDLVQAGTNTPATPIDLLVFSFDIDGVSATNPLSDYGEFVSPNSVFLNSPTRLTLSGTRASQSSTYVGFNDNTSADPRNAAGAVYLDVNSLTLRAGFAGGNNNANRTVSFDMRTSKSSSFTVRNCTDQTAPRTADLSVTKTDGVTSVNAGGSVTYTLTVSNAGPNSTAATLTDPVATGLTKTGVSCAAATGGATCPTSPGVAGLESGLALPSIPSGGTLTFTVTATVTATGGSVVNTATVSVPATTIEPNTGNNTASDTDTVTPIADLTLTKTNGVSSVNPARTTTYTITLTNNGPSGAGGTVLTDPAATGLAKTGVSCVAAGGAACPVITILTLQSGVTVATLPAGGSVTLSVTATVTAVGGSVTNSVTATLPGGTVDLTPTGTVSDTDTVSSITDLNVTKTGPAYAVPGEALTFTVTVTNTTAVPAAAYTVTDTLPAGLTYVSASNGGTYDSATRTVTWSLLSLAGSAQQTLTVTAAAPSEAQVTGGLTSVQNTASVALPGETALGNNTSAPTDTRLILTSVSKEVRNVSTGTAFGTSGGGKPGEILEYCLITRNLGGADLGAPTGYVVTDAVPASVTASLNAYDAAEPGTDTGFGVKVTRGAAPTAYLKSAAATLTDTGSTFGRGRLSVNLGVLTAGETVTICFQTTIR